MTRLFGRARYVRLFAEAERAHFHAVMGTQEFRFTLDLLQRCLIQRSKRLESAPVDFCRELLP